ncbi:hypothetical protein JG676_05300 [Campylobacter sp. 2018MI35]|uniref:hypothetical protein n=1 Tax=Campylobacter sp. 2018MI34 TaxID=2800582 RepID=UPI00190610E1|nr:hypothetical protein [Campylobacter sp. 2018MI34]MBK1992015.1 hypothetical protein [Campylobacter sp. 2018MI34]
MIALLALFAFILTWQYSSFSLIFLPLIFYGLAREFFVFLKFRKNVIKEATIIKNSLIYRLSMGDFFIYIISFFMAIFTFLSLFLNLITAQKQELVFLLAFLPLCIVFLRKKLNFQLINNAYNDFRIIIISAFLIALIYAIINLFFNSLEGIKLENFQYIIPYKNSTFFVFDFISEILTLIRLIKEYFLTSLGIFWFKIIHFIFDFFNFFVFSLSFAYIYNFALKVQNKNYVFILSFMMILGIFFIKEIKNEKLKPYQKELALFIENTTILKEQNLSSLKQNKDQIERNLKQVQDLLNKNAFELGIWWFSKEKEDLQKAINESLK